jgi:1-aminocyclopropane-1-carboxylate deaminase
LSLVNNFLPYNTPALQFWCTEESEKAGIKLIVRREDQNHAFVSGNKWWKLKYNLLQAVENKCDTVVTFGGAYSNHIYATAVACQAMKLSCVGIIRGEETLPLNSTLAFARQCGMKLYYVSREAYRRKTEADFLQSLSLDGDNYFVVPEGGTNTLATQGCAEWGEELLKTDFDYCCLPVGTGGTIAGIINAFQGKRKVIGIPVLKDGLFLAEEIRKYLHADFTNWQLMPKYHFGGYAKTTAELNTFIPTT